MNTQEFNKMQSEVLNNLNLLVGKKVIKVEEVELDPWDRTFIFHFDDGTEFKFGENSYDPLAMQLNKKRIY